jgi:hypothetical protein
MVLAHGLPSQCHLGHLCDFTSHGLGVLVLLCSALWLPLHNFLTHCLYLNLCLPGEVRCHLEGFLGEVTVDINKGI